MTPLSDALPEMMLEDRLCIPARSATVRLRVFGSLFSTRSDPHSLSRTVSNYGRLAGGLTSDADDSGVFLIWADGSVSSRLQVRGVITRGNQIAGLVTAPGDTVFLPEDQNKANWVQQPKGWTQILDPLGIGIDGIKSAIN